MVAPAIAAEARINAEIFAKKRTVTSSFMCNLFVEDVSRLLGARLYRVSGQLQAVNNYLNPVSTEIEVAIDVGAAADRKTLAGYGNIHN